MADSSVGGTRAEGAVAVPLIRLRRPRVRLRRVLAMNRVVALGGATVLGHLALGLPWGLSFLLASLVVLTGPNR